MNSYVPVGRTLPPLWPPAIWAQSGARRRLQLPRRRRPPRSCRRRRRQGRRRPPKPRRQRRPAGRGRCRYCGADTMCVRKQRRSVLLRSICLQNFLNEFPTIIPEDVPKILGGLSGGGGGWGGGGGGGRRRGGFLNWPPPPPLETSFTRPLPRSLEPLPLTSSLSSSSSEK